MSNSTNHLQFKNKWKAIFILEGTVYTMYFHSDNLLSIARHLSFHTDQKIESISLADGQVEYDIVISLDITEALLYEVDELPEHSLHLS